MKKFLIAIVLTGGLMLAGCGTTGTTVISNVTTFIRQVDAEAIKDCSFLPTDATVNALIATIPYGATFEGIAKMICAAVTAHPLSARHGRRLGGISAPTVNGVTINGSFVR